MYTESDMVCIAKRENNPKRNYLVVNRLQGKHIPVAPQSAFALFDCLADRLAEAYGSQKLLIIGFAETATAIGARLAIRLDAYYIQTTREQIPGAEYLLFSESHSHATEQKLVKNGLDKILDKVSRVVFVEDEVTTGNTILNIIRLLEQEYPGKTRFSVASLLNGMDASASALYAQKQIDLLYIQKTDHSRYEKLAAAYASDGLYLPAHTAPKEMSDGIAPILCPQDYCNARLCTQGSAYQKACESLWSQAKAAGLPGSGSSVLVLGTEEFMYPALFVGERLQRLGYTVKCHATTRSPIAASADKTYPFHMRCELESLYETGRRTFLYDPPSMDSVWIFTDAPDISRAGISTLLHALKTCKNENIRLYHWGAQNAH